MLFFPELDGPIHHFLDEFLALEAFSHYPRRRSCGTFRFRKSLNQRPYSTVPLVLNQTTIMMAYPVG